MTEHADVVIAGAGPNGLMLACELALGGVRPVVLDSLPGPSVEPKANGLVGQVVRMLDMRGLYQRFTGEGGPPKPASGWTFSGMPLNFAVLEHNPMYAMLMPQPQLVRLLFERALELGVDVRWGHELTGLAPGGDGVVLAVSGTANHQLHAGYLVGADGGRSFVRKSVGIGFPGTTTRTVARIAHVRIPDVLRAPDGAVDIPGVGRLPWGHNRFDSGMVVFAEFGDGPAMLGTVEYGTATEDGPMSLTELRASLQRVLGVDLPIEEPEGPGPHALRRIDGQNTRQAERYRDGRVLLLGDAAHVHSAMGGPGLNLGLQDAVNMGWKLAAHLTGRAPAGLLDSYETERRPVGERVMMHSQAQTALMAPGPEVQALRELFGELLTMPDVAGQMARLLAGADIRYDVGDDHPLAGRLFPDIDLAGGKRVADLLHRARPVLLDPSGRYAVSHPGIEVLTATTTDQPPAAMLIRPDGYIAWAADTFSTESQDRLDAATVRWFGPA